MYQVKTLVELQSTGYADGSACVSLDKVVNRWLYEHPDIEIANIQYFKGKDSRYDPDTAIILYIPSNEQVEEITKYQKYVDKERASIQNGYNSYGRRVNPDYIY